MDDSSLEAIDTPSLIKTDQPTPPEPPAPRRGRLLRVAAVAIGLVAIGGILFGVLHTKSSKQNPPKPTQIVINTQSLDNGTLNKLVAQNAPNQPTSQQLTISPQTIFKDSVAVEKSLTVSNDLNVKGSTTLQGATSINSNLAVRGALNVGGLLSAGSLNVGALNVSNVTASGNVTFGGHLIPTGATPTAKASNAASGGSVTISGNDTAGTITITVGNGATLAGEMAIITFRTAFATTPKVQLTPLSAAAAGLQYFATHSASFFTINSASTPIKGTTYSFDYQVSQ